MGNVLRIGTRGSRLAKWQTEHVASRLRAAHPGLEIRVREFRTTGDRDRATPLARLPGVGFFVKELEAALLDGRVDLAVHSMKDVPTQVPEGLEVGAVVPERADVRDCLVTAAGMGLEDLPRGAVVGSSSPRRRAMLLAARPDLVFVDLRGNVETRLRKLAEGACRATVLARAGLERLGMLDPRMRALAADVLMPAAGQGALGLEFRTSDDGVRRALAPLDHSPSRQAVAAERALVRRLGAGCRTPLGVLGRVGAAGDLRLEAWLLAPDGRDAIRRSLSGEAAGAAALGTALAEALLADGAARFLAPAGGDDDD
jgi:hydroxymethylbilane synthase